MLSDKRICYFCGLEKTLSNSKFRSIIEIHHIVEKNQGGDNSERNLVPCCSNHHSMIHEGKIKIDKWYMTTSGFKLHWWDEYGKEWWGKRKV